MIASYSGTPLAKKLGIKPGFRVKTKYAPANYEYLLSPIPAEVRISARFRHRVDLWHLFTFSRSELIGELESAMEETTVQGMIWVSWPKKTSGVVTDMTENAIREVAMPLGLVVRRSQS